MHGIFNYEKGATPSEAAERGAAQWRERLAQGLAQVSFERAVPDVAVAYYADLLLPRLADDAQSVAPPVSFDDPDEREELELAKWLAGAGLVAPEDAMNRALAPARWLVSRLVEEHGNRFVERLREQTVERFIGFFLRGHPRLQPGEKRSSCGAGQGKPVRRQREPAFTLNWLRSDTN
ncbi:hypothetical protein [Streptomyces sp. NPDC000983]|uniref:hypothetical protein n=1 Tax=Streptomyces sp. NPDC000983 TaxID=3154373 RepID=UPI003330C606